MIVEATYGVNRHMPREEREKRFTSQIAAIVKRGGRCLLPVVALGRAQELLLILEEYWERHPELSNVPIYQTSGLARRAMTIFQTYIEMMSEDIRTAFQVSNPFVLKYVFTRRHWSHRLPSSSLHRTPASTGTSRTSSLATPLTTWAHVSCSPRPPCCRADSAASCLKPGARTDATASSSPILPSRARLPRKFSASLLKSPHGLAFG